MTLAQSFIYCIEVSVQASERMTRARRRCVGLPAPCYWRTIIFVVICGVLGHSTAAIRRGKPLVEDDDDEDDDESALHSMFHSQEEQRQQQQEQLLHSIPLLSSKYLIHQHHRRLSQQNKTQEAFIVEEQLIRFESLRHLSRYEQAYRIENGLLDVEREADEWDGHYHNEDCEEGRKDNVNATDVAKWKLLDLGRVTQKLQPWEENGYKEINRGGNQTGQSHRSLLGSAQQLHNADSFGPSSSTTTSSRFREKKATAAKSSPTQTTKLHRGKFDNYQAIPLSQGYGTHIANVWVGSPKPQRKTVIVDTGSHYTAFPCKGCKSCGRTHHTDPYYDPTRSSTFRQLECDECTGGVGCEKGHCHFSQAYTEGSSWDAIQVKDHFYCGGKDVIDSVDPIHHKYAIDFMFGCMTKMSGLFLTQLADGIMGMSAHQATLPKQLWDKGVIEHNMFAMCFRRELGTSKRGVSAGSMTIGGVSTNLDTGPVVYAKNMARAGWFTVFVKNIYIRTGGGQSSLDNDSDQDNGGAQTIRRRTVKVKINVRTVNSGKGVIVDSGTTDTYLSKTAAPAFKNAWKEATGGRAYSHSPVKLSDEELHRLPTVLVQCHAYSATKDPSIDDYNSIPGYTGDLDPSSPEDLLIAIPATSYMDYSPTTKLYTSRLYFTETAGGVLGSNTMQGHNVVFDWEHHRIGFAESSCSYDKNDAPEFAEDSGYASDCQVKEPVLSQSCIDSVDKPLCKLNQTNVVLLGTEKWAAVVKDPGTRLGKLCTTAAQEMEVKDQYRDPVVTCNSMGVCEEERPCQLTCPQVQRASQIVKNIRDNSRLKCGDSLWSACDRMCVQTRMISAAFSDGKCHEITRESRPCHIDACAREDPCRAPYSVRLVLGLGGLELGQWSAKSEIAISTSISNAMDKNLGVGPGDIAVRLARSWFLDEDSPDAAAGTHPTGKTKAHGLKAIVDVAIASKRENASIADETTENDEHWRIWGNLTQLGETPNEIDKRCFDEDLFVLARRALLIKNTVLREKKFLTTLIQQLTSPERRDENRVFMSSSLLNESRVVAAWSFRNGVDVDDKVNYLGPRKPWWFGIFRVLHFTTVLLTTSLVLWSLFGVFQHLNEHGFDLGEYGGLFDLRSRLWWPRQREHDSNPTLSDIKDHTMRGLGASGVAEEGVPLVIKVRESHRHSARRRNGVQRANSESTHTL